MRFTILCCLCVSALVSACDSACLGHGDCLGEPTEIPICPLFAPTPATAPDGSVRGELNHTSLYGTCADPMCTESDVLALGSSVDLVFTIDQAFEGDLDELDAFSIASDAPALLSVQASTPGEITRVGDEQDEECSDEVPDHVRLDVSVLPRKSGTAHLTITRGKMLIDRYELVIGEGSAN